VRAHLDATVGSIATRIELALFAVARITAKITAKLTASGLNFDHATGKGTAMRDGGRL